MARRKNLLEAFQRSEANAGEVPASASPPTTLFDLPSGRGGRSLASSGWPLAVVAVVLAFALGYVLGRGSQPAEVHAEPAPLVHAPPLNQPRAFQERPPSADASRPATTGEAPKSLEESPLFDPANLYTVIVASYTKGKTSETQEKNRDLAWATYKHLKEEGLQVFPPVESGNLLVVLVGAASTRAALEGTVTQVRGLVRDGKKNYDTAYSVRIDQLIPRTQPGESKP
jgi:hypothetical protein